jgi:hypothetical protein
MIAFHIIGLLGIKGLNSLHSKHKIGTKTVNLKGKSKEIPDRNLTFGICECYGFDTGQGYWCEFLCRFSEKGVRLEI